MRIKTLKLFVLLLGCIFSFGQTYTGNVGVNTLTPQANLHVNGTMQVTKDLYFGGDDSTKGNSGNDGQVLVSSGKDLAPKWLSTTEVKIPIEVAFYKRVRPVTMTYNKFNANIPFDKKQILNTEYLNVDTDINGNAISFEIMKTGNYQISGFAICQVNALDATNGFHRNIYLNILKGGVAITGYNNQGSPKDHEPKTSTIFIGTFIKGERFYLSSTIVQSEEGTFDLKFASIGVQYLGN